MDSEMQTLIEQSIRDNAVVLFMKGTRSAPQCGFSARVVQILDSLLPDYQTLNVLSEPEARKLTVLININREIAAGLRERG